MTKWVLRTAVALGPAVLLLSSCSKHESAQAEATAAPQAQTAVPVVKAEFGDVAGSIALTGEFIPFQEVDVMSKVAGYIKSINVDVGDHVKKGQVLATLEIPEMEDDVARAASAIQQSNSEAERAAGEVRRAEAAREMTKLSYTRIENVLKREPGLVPQQEVDEARARDLQTEAQLAGAQSALSAARERTRGLQADASRLNTMRKYETIVAPFDGVVTKRYANTGSMIQAGTASQSQAMPVVKISQNNLLRLILPVPESSVSHVAIGQSLDVKVPSVGRTFRGKVARFTDKVQTSTRSMDTEVDVPNPSLALIPGMYAEVDLQLQRRNHVVTVPLDALDGSGPTARVFAITPAGTIHVVPVTTGLQTAQLVEIVDGVKEGDTVVIGRHAGLKEGDQVKATAATFANAERAK